jgi:hypothetical protein
MEGAKLNGLLTTDNLSEFLLPRRFGMEPVVWMATKLDYYCVRSSFADVTFLSRPRR